MSQSAPAIAGPEPALAASAFDEDPPRRRRAVNAFTISATLLAAVVIASAAGRAFGFLHPYTQNLSATLQAPSLQHWFGTDDAGRDVFDRTLYASLLDLEVGVISTVVPLAIGLIVGAIVGYVGGALDAVVMRIMDVILAFPALILMLGLAAIYGSGLTTVYIGLIVTSIPVFVRLTRGEMLVLREQQFMFAAKTLGLSRRRIIVRHAAPHLLRANLVYGLSNVVGNIAYLATLSYLGLGVQPPTPEWGAIIAEGQQYLLTQWWISTLPGLFMVIVCVALFVTGEELARRVDVGLAGAR